MFSFQKPFSTLYNIASNLWEHFIFVIKNIFLFKVGYIPQFHYILISHIGHIVHSYPCKKYPKMLSESISRHSTQKKLLVIYNSLFDTVLHITKIQEIWVSFLCFHPLLSIPCEGNLFLSGFESNFLAFKVGPPLFHFGL